MFGDPRYDECGIERGALLPLVEAQGGLDYVFIYRSQAEQHHLKCVYLPAEINLGSPSLAEHYRRVSVEVAGTRQKSKFRQVGRPIVYGVTVLSRARRSDLALEFVKFLLSETGASIMQETGQVVISPALVAGERVPKEIECLVKKSVVAADERQR